MSNPFLDGSTILDPSEMNMPVPTTIVVESPDSRQCTAWTNLGRFPSLHRPHPATRTSLTPPPTTTSSSTSQPPRPASQAISIYGPREISRKDRGSDAASHIRDQKRYTIDAHTVQHKLQHYSRQHAFTPLTPEELISSPSSQGSTPRSSIQLSDDEEFAYLPSAHSFMEESVPASKPTDYFITSSVPIPEPLRFKKHRQQAATFQARHVDVNPVGRTRNAVY